MTVNELLQRPPIRSLQTSDYTFAIIREEYFDARRVWVLAIVLSDQHPIAVLQRAGREGDDFCRDLVLDKTAHRIFRNRRKEWQEAFWYGQYADDRDLEAVPVKRDQDYGSNTHGDLVSEFYYFSLDEDAFDSGDDMEFEKRDMKRGSSPGSRV
jgi:hypothetical protein